MGSLSQCIKTIIILVTITLSHCFTAVVAAICECEPPSPPAPPQPENLTFLDKRLALVYPVIQLFKSTITADPLGITQSWVGPDICNYTGFFCGEPPDNASALALASINFNGFQLAAPTLEGFIDQLPDLAIFHANTNNFSGTIPPGVSKLQFLFELDISNNKFFGAFPAVLLGVTGLGFLDIRFNFFAGTVPPQVFTQSLDFLFINNNNFLSKLPENLGSTPVSYLTLANNRFTGPIPRSIGKASSTLREVLFLNNRLTGCIPYELGFLRKATVIDAGNNLLTGPLPCSLACLENIEQLNFTGNLLFGAVPEVACAALKTLVNFSLSYNYFTHVGPICRNLIKSGALDLRKNCIRGLPDQRSRFECAVFFALPRFCPYFVSYWIIPCKLPHPPFPFPFHNGTRGHDNSVRPKRHLISYSALWRHRFR
ncbi:uncharacterized protein At4g06744-like isoform X2 [Diospyros lotus]|uniref:uncharacterized protein At4g06744-like isoform X2 n=1 Tax=Diospyros lotus TaxID=55363 RepID=UPI0022562A01|nr:uncharacterized protein At4g06744-like isoform X2 [Diospyros lotus]